MNVEKKYTVSIVIPTYCRRDSLLKALRSLVDLDWDPFDREIIIVDDGSRDGTVEELERVAKSIVGFRYIKQANLGPAIARNAGVNISTGEFIFFMDDDCVADKSWIRESIKLFSDPEVGGVGGTIKYRPPNNSWANKCAAHEASGCGQPVDRQGKLQYLITANAAVRKIAFTQVGGFDKVFRYAAHEDIDLSYRLLANHWKLALSFNTYVDHYHDFTFIGMLVRSYQIGIAEKILILKSNEKVSKFKNLVLAFWGLFLIIPGFLKNYVNGIEISLSFGKPFIYRLAKLANAIGKLG